MKYVRVTSQVNDSCTKLFRNSCIKGDTSSLNEIWNDEDDKKLLKLIQQLGNKWKVICKEMKRSYASVISRGYYYNLTAFCKK